MAFFRPMGADSVAYHEKTVVGREDDHPGQALDYYGTRGETPLRWGGRLAARLGLSGEVTLDQYKAAFGPGGFRHPTTGEQLTTAKRPGFEWVIGPHKSVAVLGVIGRADDMHAILDAERDATLAAVEDWWCEQGGSRGRAQTRTPTTGLAWAVARHGTTRSGDPHPHDHILFPNITEMRDERGGFKALDSAALRDLTEPLTMIGRLHGATKAIELGYAIEIDQGKSGRARRWRIAGIPDEVCELFSKRADEIARYLEERGQSSYRARNIAACATRDVKRHTGVDELMPHWQAELEQIGWSVERLAAALDEARTQCTSLLPPLTGVEIDAITAELMAPDSAFLANRKVFNRWHLIQEIAPMLYGHHPDELWHVLDRVIASELVVPLIGGPYSRERTYASAHVLAAEQTIAETIDRLAQHPGPDVHRSAIRDAIARKRDEVSRPLTAGQRAAVDNICGPVGGVKVVVGVAGSGKTTALDAASRALEDAGYTVVGTATSGQAARTLGQEAGIEARTTRSLLWRLNHGQLSFTNRTVLILDEAGMTADADLAPILHAAHRTGATVVLVGDPRQLAPVGPGGALAAVLQQHPEIVTAMGQNVRQADPAEAAALLEVRHGDPDTAIDFYVTHDRIRTDPQELPVLHEMAKTWAADTAAGHDTVMLAWRRESVAKLNRFGRAEAEKLGRIQGDDLIAPGRRAYAIGDQVVTLAPNYEGDLVTSQRGTITDVDHEAQVLTLTTDGGRQVRLWGEQLDADHLDHGYALTVHRTQGATADRAHYLAEGGGRELAYVALSRARDRTTIYAVADDLDQARADLGYHWSSTQAQDWITLTHQPAPRPQPARRAVEPGPVEPIPLQPPAEEPAVSAAALDRSRVEPDRPLMRREKIVAKLERVNHGAPPDVTQALAVERHTLDRLRQDRADLDSGRGRWRDQPEGHATRALDAAQRRLNLAQHHADAAGLLARPLARAALHQADSALHAANQHWARAVPAAADRVDQDITTSEQHIAAYERHQQERNNWLARHPEKAHLIYTLERELFRIDHPTEAHMLDHLDHIQHQATHPPERGLEPPALGL